MKTKLIKTLNGMGMGLLATLVVGTIMEQIGSLIQLNFLIEVGGFAKVLMAVAIGVGVSSSLEAKPLVIYASVVTAAIGASAIQVNNGQMVMVIGEPAGAYVASVATVLIGKRVSGKTPVDILLVPLVCLIIGGLVALFIAPFLTLMTGLMGALINQATEVRPAYMGAIVSATFCLVILSPISSAALAVSLGLEGLAAGAAVAGCASSMVGFAVTSFKDNGFGGLISQGIGTSKIQFGNSVKNPYIVIPTLVASLIAGPISTTMVQLQCNSLGAGMGSSGFVGQIQTLAEMGVSALPSIILVQIIIPAVVSFGVGLWLSKKGYICSKDMLLPSN